MVGAQWLLELALVLLLTATLFHAIRLERALGVLKRDRAVLEGLVEGFNKSTRDAESSVEHLRVAAEGAGRRMTRQIEQSQRLRDDLTFLSERGERLAERLESVVRAARMVTDAQAMVPVRMSTAPAPAHETGKPPPAFATAFTQKLSEDPSTWNAAKRPAERAGSSQSRAAAPSQLLPEDEPPRLRSQAERDLLRAMRARG